ncbi:LacI family DNA-binding transcriptional regulator [Marinomonas sp. IMCC 4694]|uniref:LacI family DNA-binding transcriptional regulator n=1 Tax=Marinomonas sp. IMCC 4694 TaxID=2605432 RepID=UPI0011E6A7B7|nr:LacI family DNA-binding transcriptional regulator [Marinomonas sp. IMCC 4694]TYL48763.1 LacI family DNA-binding transcriptional regulator [Marinomonas sp. IMCC 4694]
MQKKTKGFATIFDVAHYAKVGKTSVSRYLNGEQDKLSDSLRDKIAHAIEQLDFRPNHSARMLKAGHSKLIGLLLADVTNPYSIAVLQGIEGICQREGYMLMVCNTDNQIALQDKYISLLEAHRVDGIIINTTGMTQKHLANVERLSCPLVLIDRFNTSFNVDAVGLDNEHAVLTVCDHLKMQHYHSILTVTEPVTIEPRFTRVETVKRFAEKNDQTYRIVEIEKTSVDQLAEAITQFIESDKGTKKAIFATNGVAMMSVAKALKQQGVSVGTDIGFIGIDDPEWAQLFDNGITVMRQPTQQIGQIACEHLLSRIQGNLRPPQHIKLKATLVIRHST